MQQILNFLLLASYLILGSVAYTTYFANAETAQNAVQAGDEAVSGIEQYLDLQSAYVVQEGDTLLSVALEMGVDLQEMYCLLPPNFQQDQPLVIGEQLSPPLPNTACHQIRDGETLLSIAEIYKIAIPSLIGMPWNQAAYPNFTEMRDDMPLPVGMFLRIPGVPQQRAEQVFDEALEQDTIALKRLLQEPIVNPALALDKAADHESKPKEESIAVVQQPDAKPMVSMVVGVNVQNEVSDNSDEQLRLDPSVEPPVIRNDAYPTSLLRLESDSFDMIGPTPNEWPYGSGRFIWPLQGWLTQNYHGHHRALDIAAPIGTPIVAVDRGTVTRAGWNDQGYGLFVIIDHNIGYVTLYAHLSEVWVKAGDVVTQGQFLGTVGSTGNSTGPHLHLELRDFGKRVDPLDFLGQ